MNKILVAARKAKGASETDVATLLKLPLHDYQALECSQRNITSEQAKLLARFFSLPAWFFLEPNKPLDIADRIDLLKKHLQILSQLEYKAVPPGATMALATTTIELMIAKEELSRSLSRELELAEDIAALTMMCDHLTSLLNSKS